jgi:DNA mismatch repair protein MutS
MDYPKEIKVKDYFKIHNYYSNIYGYDRTIILMQVGSFHESYSTNSEGLNLEAIAQDLDVICTAKNSKKEISSSNPRMLGFPIHVIDNFVEKLVDLNYTVVVIDQVSDPPNPERKVTRIESPATFISKTKSYSASKANFLVSLYFDKISSSNPLLGCGMSSYDLSTGKGYFFESYSKKNDIHMSLDDTIRFLEMYPPQELVIHFNFSETEKVSNMTVEEIKSYLKINEDIVYQLGNYKQYTKIKYQKDILDRIFTFENMISSIDNIGLTHLNWARIALVSLLDYVRNHQSNLINKLQKPEQFENSNNLYLGNRALEQLNVLPTNGNKSLYNIISSAKSIIGKRYLRGQLSNPISNVDVLSNRYDLIEKFIDEEVPQKINLYLENIYDIEKIIRKMEINIVNPSEVAQLFKSLNNFGQILNTLEDVTFKDLDNEPFEQIFDTLSSFIKKWEEKFNLEQMEKINFVNYIEDDVSFFQPKIYPEIDKIQEEIDTCNNFLDELVKALSALIDDKNYFYKNKDLINVKFNERDGHYLMLTNRRCKLLKSNIEKNKKLKVGSITIESDNLEFIELSGKSSNTKIKCKKLNDLSSDLVSYKQKLAKKMKEVFYSEIKDIINVDGKNLRKYCNIIGMIDFINSGAITAKKLGYSKPIIENKYESKSYFNANDLRHPIVEQINEKVLYYPHSISLGEDLNGILLYGINSSGKSTLMKSVGLNVILAQIGYFVAAKEYKYYPYNTIFTRICGNDDIYRGLSSFMVEMIELMSILKRNDKNTLVIGDEICRGTEEKSANIIVAYMLEKLEQSDTTFITATHLHKIADLPCVKNIKKVKPYHLKVSYDDDNETIIYQRELTEGQGDKFYGLQVAKYLMRDKHFNERTKEIMEEFDDTGKTSRYNSDVKMEECYFCQSTEKLECHHINWQKDFDENNINKENPHIMKNKFYNLLVVCQSCHDMIDREDINVKGWVMTSKGIDLDYSICKKKKKKKKRKYDKDIIDQINKIKDKFNTTKEAKLYLRDKLDVKISSTTISKIWKNEYVC